MDKCSLTSKEGCVNQDVCHDEPTVGDCRLSQGIAENPTKANPGSDPLEKKFQVLSCRGLRSASGAVDRDLWQWYCETQAKHQGAKVSKSIVQARAKWAFHQAGIVDFKASDGWYRRWIKRWRKFDETKTHEMVNGPPPCPTNSGKNSSIKTTPSNGNDGKRIKKAVNGKRVEENDRLENRRTDSRKENVSLLLEEGKDYQTACLDPSHRNSSSKRKIISVDTEKQPKINKTSQNISTSDVSEEPKGENGQSRDFNTERSVDTSAMLSTPMLNIVDYLPPEIMHNLQNDIPNNLTYENTNGSTNSESINNVFAASDIDASMDSLYYPPSCELSLQNHVLSDCENETLSNISNFPFEINQMDPCAFPTAAEADRMKDIIGLISSQHNCSQANSSNLLCSFSPSQMEHNGNVISACSSEGCESFVNSVFRDVSLRVGTEDQSDNSIMARNIASTISHDVLAPEVILESHAPSVGHETNINRKLEGKDSSSKRSKKSSRLIVKQHKKGEKYLPQFKIKVLAYAANHTLKETAKKFKVYEGTISCWKKENDWKKQLAQKADMSACEGSAKKKTDVPVIHPVDQQFLTWLRRCREQSCEFTAVELKDKARQMVQLGSADSCHWFRLWVSRFDEKFVYEEGQEKMKHKQDRHIQYPVAFKVEVAAFAEHHSQVVAARTFNVSRKRVFEWLQAHRAGLLLDAEPPEGSTNHTTGKEDEVSKKSASRRSDIDKEIDQQIWIWYQGQQTNGKKPSWHEVQAKGLELYREKGKEDIKCSYQWYKRWCDRYHIVLRHEGDDAMLEWALTQLELGHSLTHNDLQVHALSLVSDNTFKASHGWAIRFCKRHPELLQQIPSLDTALPGPLLQKVKKFRVEVQKTVHDGNLALGCIGNMDELYLNFSTLVSGFGGNAKHQNLVRRSEMENCHATIVLACLADGNILPPAVILKITGLENEVELPDGAVVVLHQEEGVMDSICMQQWLEQVWFKHVPAPNLLLLDCHEPHTGDSIVAEFMGHKSSTLIIPGGCTSKLQPLDISLKNLFHASIQRQWSVFNSRATGDKLHLPSRKEIVDWVTVTYQKLQATDQETVRRSFLVTGLTVAANQSEDHFIENLSMIPQANIISA